MQINTHDEVSAIITHFRAELSDPSRPFTLLVHLKFREGMHKAVSDAWAGALKHTMHDKGMMTFNLNQHPKDTSRYVVYERWASLADLEAHLRTPHATDLRNRFNGLLDGVPEFHVLLPAGE